jgi:hypothetical protein
MTETCCCEILSLLINYKELLCVTEILLFTCTEPQQNSKNGKLYNIHYTNILICNVL